ncbi:MAG: DNA internalization-related competence protein ComEC/Rec2 [Rhodocyclaceae bacterium]|nr:DNA internalization-related competence protein ComEC/Rec2 [Rhodocyclaceae bacterium]
MTSFAIGFVLALTWLQQQARLPESHYQWLLLGAAALLGALARLLHRRPRKAASIIALCLLGGVCAVLWGSWRAEARLAERLPAALEGEDVVVSGRIAAMPQQTERGWRFEFAVDEPAQVPRRISLAWYASGFNGGGPGEVSVPPLHAGDRWQLTVRLKQPHGNLNPHGFDYEAWLFERGIRATGYVRPRGERRLLEASGGDWVERSREAVRTRFERTLGDAPYAGVLIALAVGDQQAVPRSQWDIFARTGITHLVSISGLHVTMLAGLAFALVSLLWRRVPLLMLYLPAQRAAVIGGIAAAAFYCLLAGFAVPAQRTLYMLTVVALALWTQRNLATRTVLMLALLLVVLIDPWAVMAPGFWLSFGAVAVLFYIGSGRLAEGHWLKQWGRAQWAMSLGMLPVLLLLFQQFSLVSPLANAVAIPLVSFVITPLVLLATVPGLEFLLHPAHAAMSALMWLMQWLAALPGAAWQQAAAPLSLTLLALAGCLWLLLPRGMPARWLGLLPLAALLLWAPPRPGAGELRVTVLDVGQGLAAHVQTAGHDLLFDAGPAFSEEADSGNRIILPYLRAQGIGTLDLLVVTHADIDHSGGAESVVDGVAVERMATSVPFENHLSALPVEQQPCIAGDAWEWDGVRFEFLHPLAADYEREQGKSNDMSCVLKLESAHGSMLLTGDIEARSESQLLARVGEKLRADVLLVPHHGSRTSSTPEFLAAVDAKLAIIPVGYRNRFRHPHPAVLARYDGIPIRRTDRDGAVTVRYSAGNIEAASARTEYRRYWQQ